MIETLLANGLDATTMSHGNIGDKSGRQSLKPAIFFGESPLGTAIKMDKSQDLWVLQMLLNYGADPNSVVLESPNRTALLAAIDQNNPAMLGMLLRAGADKC